jgi:hypothetical protein
LPLPIQPGAYTDCYEIWAQAEALGTGCRTLVGPNLATAEYLRMRMHQARKLLRDQSRRAYPKEHPLHNTSEYDRYKLTIKSDEDDNYYLYVEPHGDWGAVRNIEPIPPDEILPGPAPPAPAFPRAIPTPTHEPANAEQDSLD